MSTKINPNKIKQGVCTMFSGQINLFFIQKIIQVSLMF